MLLQVTNVGLTTAAALQAAGHTVLINSFSVGSGFGYTATADDTALHGTSLYSGTPANFQLVDTNTVQYLIRMNELVGSFNWGEIGLFILDLNSNPVLFALGCNAYQTPKLATTATVPGNVISEIVQLVFNNASTTIDYTIVENPEAKMLQINGIALLSAPNTSPTNSYITTDVDDQGNVILAQASSGTQWTFPTHSTLALATGIVTAATTTSVSAADIPNDGSLVVGRYIIQFLSGNLEGEARLVTVLNGTSAQWSQSFVAAPAVNDRFQILQSNVSYYGNLYSEFLNQIAAYYTQDQVNTLLQGNASQTFDVATATTPTEATPLAQVQSLITQGLAPISIWSMIPVGVPFPVLIDLGALAPDQGSTAYRYLKLTSNDAYNTGFTTNESQNGSAPYITATATVSCQGSPLNGQTIHMLNTEQRTLVPGTVLSYYEAVTTAITTGGSAVQTTPRYMSAQYFMRIL